MRKVLPIIALLFAMALSAQAQYPLVTVQDIQTVTPMQLAACVDSSTYNNDTVRVQGVVVTPSADAAFTTATRGQIWIRSGYGPFSGLDVIQFDDPNSNGMSNLLPGDSVEITGVITEYQGSETEIIPLSGVNISILGSGSTISPTVVPVSDLNDASQSNNVATGEQWEGQYIEVQNVTVVSVDPFSGGTRVSFVVQDAQGNKLNVSDKFLAQRLPTGNPPGSFVAPNPGDTYAFIRGILVHSPNGCTGASGRGYEINPTDTSDYNQNSAAPSIVSVTRNLVTPTSSQAVTVTASISDGNGVGSATLYYAVGVGNNNYTQVTMTMTGGTAMNGTWEGDIPAQTDGSFVKYYVCATDISNNTSCSPNVPNQTDPSFYTVRDNGTTIVDIQFVPSSFSSDRSGYNGMDVTVEGVVTGSAEPNGLGFVFIQQENELAWSGIMCTDNPALATLTVGQKVTVTGTVNENFRYTRLEQISSVQVNGTGSITPVDVDPSDFTNYDIATNEAYEGMLVTLRNPDTTACLTVVDPNPASPSNFAEWRVGKDPFSPGDGCLILTGRVTNSAYSSLNVSYVNDIRWATDDGVMNVPPIVVQGGDKFGSITGVMAFTFGSFKLLPRNNDDFAFFGPCALSIEDALLGDIKAYPNPVDATFNLSYSFEGVMNGVTANVYDIMGRNLKTVALGSTSGETTIDAADLAPGTYVLKVVSNDGVIGVLKFNKVQ